MLAALDRVTPVQKAWGGANSSAFRAALLKVNGFDESMKYGGEDKELGVRLTNGGVRGQHLRYTASVVHLDHPRGYADPAIIRANKARVAEVQALGTELDAGRHREGGRSMIADVINLDRAPERWSSMTRLATTRGLAVRRVAAVDGRDPAALAGAAAAPERRAEPAPRSPASRATGWPGGAWRRETSLSASSSRTTCSRPDRRRWTPSFRRRTGSTFSSSTPTRAAFSSMSCRSPAEDGRTLLRAAQGSSDSSAYLISRGFAARALEIHRGYRQALDLALFDPATGVVVGQVDPGLTIQQRYADFRFLDEGARKSDIQAPSRMRRRRRPLEAVVREGKRVWRRRIVPALQPLLNLARPAAERIVFRRIAFRA